MKWLIVVLLCLNLFVFVLAFIADDVPAGYGAVAELPEDVQTISLLGSDVNPGAGNCTNLGPIEQAIVLERFQRILDQQATTYKVISEPKRMIAAYRVKIPASDSNDLKAITDRLKSVGIEEVYEKTAETGEPFLSLGVFTYEKTARDYATNLTNTGFAATYQSEFLEYPPRSWLNLKKALDEKIIKSLNEYIGSNKLTQTSSTCL